MVQFQGHLERFGRCSKTGGVDLGTPVFFGGPLQIFLFFIIISVLFDHICIAGTTAVAC